MRADPELGTVQRCRRCGEEWPLDAEFWPMQKRRLDTMCSACWSEYKAELKQRKRVDVA